MLVKKAVKIEGKIFVIDKSDLEFISRIYKHQATK